MKTRFHQSSILGALVVIGVCVLLALFFFNRSSEPSYDGLKFSEWLEKTQSGSETEQDAAKKALLAIGTNGIPYLVAILWLKDSDLQKKADRSLVQLQLLKKNTLLFSPKRHALVIGAMSALVPKRDEVIEALQPYLDDPEFRVRAAAYKAVGYLAYADPTATNVTLRLLGGLRDDSVEVRRASASLIRSIANASMSNGVAILLDALRDSDLYVRDSITNALRAIAPQR